MQETEWQWLRQARKSPAEMTAFFRRWQPYVWKLALGFAGHALADDITQEVMLRVMQKRWLLTPRAKFSTWLYQLVLNVSREQIRKQQRAQGDLDVQLLALPVPDQAEVQLQWQAFIEHLNGLPQRQREVVVLRFLQGFGTRETAEIMGCSEGSVKTHLHRAVQQLRARNEDNPVNENRVNRGDEP